MFNNRDRMEADRRSCGELFVAMGVRVRGSDLRFCRRVGERSAVPRPVVAGLNNEEEKRTILSRARQLRGGKYDNVSVVPDLTRMQRRGEDKLTSEADSRNGNLTADDREKGLRWIVVGKRGEKRLIKGVEREPQRDRAPATLGQFIRPDSRGAGTGMATVTGSRAAGPETGARQRDTYGTGHSSRLLSPIRRSGEYVPVQHANGNPRWQNGFNNAANYSSNAGYRSGNNGEQGMGGFGNGGYENSNGHRQTNGGYTSGGYGGRHGGGYSGNGGNQNMVQGTGLQSSSNFNSSGGYGNANGYNNGQNIGHNSNFGNGYNQEMDRQPGGAGRADGYGINGQAECTDRPAENSQYADTDRHGSRQGITAEPVVPQPGHQRPRLGSKRGRDGASGITDISPPRTRQRQ
jgi:hypothetical protein